MSANLYDDLDLLYRRIWGNSLHHGFWKTARESAAEARQNLSEEVAALLRPCGTIADIGCGYGEFSRKLAEEFGCEVHSFTDSKKQAKAFPPRPHIHVHCRDWLDHDLPEHSLDGAVAIESLSHFENFDHFLARTGPALRPGASLVIADWFGPGGESRLLRHLATVGEIPPWRVLEVLKAAAKTQNLIVAETHDISGQVARTWTALFFNSCLLPLRDPAMLVHLIRQSLRRPALLWSFPLLRLAYHRGLLQYHLIRLEKPASVSSRPET